MNFNDLHENLRLEILRRIDRGTLSGSTLARATGFQQAHISNFINRKRLLSLDGLDRVLKAQNMTVLDILPADNSAFLSNHNKPVSMFHTVAVVTHSAAAYTPRIQSTDIMESVEIPDTVLHLTRSSPSPGRTSWQRFVAIRVDARQAAAMDPLLRTDLIAVIDRHYNSFAKYRSQLPTIYAVSDASSLHLCFLEFDANRLIVRPSNHQQPVHLVELSSGEKPSDRIVGRICYVLSEF